MKNRIRKQVESFRVTPNLLDYTATCREFSWQAARRGLQGLPEGGGLNMAHEAVDRHANGPRAAHTALRWLGKAGAREHYSYRDLAAETSRFANALGALGVESGERVFLLLGRVPELYFAMLGALKARCVVTPLFSAFGPEPVATRMQIGAARVLVTTETLYRRKVAPVREQLPALEHVILVDRDASIEETALAPGLVPWSRLVGRASPEYVIEPTDPETPALLHFTSGTTGRPKGAVHVHEAIVTHHVTGRYALDLHDQDIFWCTADPGWVTGTSYGVLAPLSCGVTVVVVEAEYDPATWYGVLQDEAVSVWYTAPTAVRMMMRAGLEMLADYRFPSLRFVASVGEPLNAEAVVWGESAFGCPIHDNWWQTETGGIMISNFAGLDIKPGSMGRPLPGVEAAIVRREADGGVAVADEPDVEGELALRSGWPSMMRAYLDEDERYRKCFAGDWYLSGDLARQDAEGYFWFLGRADDVIKSSGHLVGPFEVESALMEHPAVVEAAVIGVPDETAGQLIKAFVTLHQGHAPDEAMRRNLLGHARKRLGPAVAPKFIEFLDQLPKTRSGKVLRRLLRARELGLPEGDLSTLETDSR